MMTYIGGRDFSGTYEGAIEIHFSDGKAGPGTQGRDMIAVTVDKAQFYLPADQILDVETPEPPSGWRGRPSVTVTKQCQACEGEGLSLIVDGYIERCRVCGGKGTV